MGTKLTENTSTTQKIPAIIVDLLENASRYDFIAAVKLIRVWLLSQQLPITWPQVKCVAHLSLAFSTAEIQAITRSNDNHFIIYANFLTIYGTASPLPNYYTEYLFSSINQDNPVVREFLDLFQHRLYEKYFELHQSVQLTTNTDASNHYTQQIYSLAGLGNQSLIPTIPQNRLLRYAGLLSCKLRTYSNLLKLLSDYAHVSLEIEPYFRIKRAIATQQYALLGQKNCSLGDDCHLGQSYYSMKNSIKIYFLNLSIEQFKNLLPGQRLSQEVSELIKLYVLQTINVHVELQLHPASTQQSGLCHDSQTRLGMNSWLGQSRKVSPLNLAYQLM